MAYGLRDICGLPGATTVPCRDTGSALALPGASEGGSSARQAESLSFRPDLPVPLRLGVTVAVWRGVLLPKCGLGPGTLASLRAWGVVHTEGQPL